MITNLSNNKTLFYSLFLSVIIFVSTSLYASTTISTNIITDGNVGIGTATPGAKLEIQGDGNQLLLTGGSLATDGTENWLNVTGTFPTQTTNTSAVRFNITPNTSATSGQWGLYTSINAASVTSSNTIGTVSLNSVSNTTNNLRISVSTGTPFGNLGLYSAAVGTGTGLNLGVFTEAVGGILNIGVGSKSIVAKDSATNVAVMGVALNTAVTSPIQVGGYFGLQNTTPTFTSAALIANNGSQTSPIFLAQDNGSTIFSILDGGNVGIGTTTPQSKLHVTSGASATTTINVGELGSATSYACFNTKNTVGTDISFYFVGTTMVVESNTCR
ncbi:MAG: hypothetical protein WCW47_00400 [Candidatus Paceibacterota bacterium]|jgi:hypothetical protein